MEMIVSLEQIEWNSIIEYGVKAWIGFELPGFLLLVFVVSYTVKDQDVCLTS